MKICLSIIALLVVSAIPAFAQDAIFPLPADLYILTSDHMIVRVDAANGGQTIISPEDQPVSDFAIAPDGAWYVYRTSASNAVIVSEIAGFSGYVLEFDVPLPSEASGQSIAWSPDASTIAYLVPGGVRIAGLGAGDYGEALLSSVQGGPWTDVHWTASGVLVVRDASGAATQISGQYNAWTVETLNPQTALPETAVSASLMASGVNLANGSLIPGTAGALDFDWGLPAPQRAASLPLPATLYFLMPDANGTTQVWVLPQSGEPRRAVTGDSAPVINYDVAPGQTRIAYATAARLITANLDGSNRTELAQLSTEMSFPFVAWSPDARQIAYSDQRGLWLVPADASQPPRLLLQNQPGAANVNPNDIRIYFDPRWSPDGTRLLIGIGFFEGGVLGVVDPAAGTLTELDQIIASRGRWTDDGRVMTWSAAWGYETPGLYVLDPANPGLPPGTVLDTRYPVVDVVHNAAGGWAVLVSSTSQMGPQFLRVLGAESLAGPFAPLVDGGGFAQEPLLAVSDQQIVAAGLREMVYDEARGVRAGELVVIDMSSGDTFQIDTGGALVHELRWGD